MDCYVTAVVWPKFEPKRGIPLNRILEPLLAFATALPLAAAPPPTVGEKARDFIYLIRKSGEVDS